MASETFTNRAELRRRLRARMGSSTDDAVNVQTTPQINEYLREAAQMVRDAGDWPRLTAEYFFSTAVDERFYNYPAAGTGGSALAASSGDIIAISRWDNDAYVPLVKAQIPSVLDNDPSMDSDAEIATRGEPILWQEASQVVGGIPTPAIELNPLPDAIYPMKAEYVLAFIFNDDTNIWRLDADAIVAYAYAEYLDAREKPQRADLQRKKARARIDTLLASQRAGMPIKFGRGETRRLAQGSRRLPPNFDTGLSVMPP